MGSKISDVACSSYVARQDTALVPPGAASAGVVAMECDRVTWRVRGHPCNTGRREFPDAGKSLPTRRVGWDGPRPADLDTVNDHPARRTPISARGSLHGAAGPSSRGAAGASSPDRRRTDQ